MHSEIQPGRTTPMRQTRNKIIPTGLCTLVLLCASQTVFAQEDTLKLWRHGLDAHGQRARAVHDDPGPLALLCWARPCQRMSCRS